jgi:hypothetical protein
MNEQKKNTQELLTFIGGFITASHPFSIHLNTLMIASHEHLALSGIKSTASLYTKQFGN